MRYLLDTHTVLWFFHESKKLSRATYHLILDPSSEKWVSIVSAWELAIKIGKKTIDFDGGVSEFFRMVDENGFGLQPIRRAHIKTLETLPLLHKDPFDRMLIAQSLSENMPLVSCDEAFDQYGIQRFW